MFMPDCTVAKVSKGTAADVCIKNHYLHRRPPMSFSFGLFWQDAVVGVVTFGSPPSRHLQKSVLPETPDLVIELNRLWTCDALPKNAESWFIRRAIKQLPPKIIVSYADTSAGHAGYVYRAAGFNYAGWTDMDRKTPRFDYVVPGKHSRDAFRNGDKSASQRVRRLPKIKYWTASGDRRQRRELTRRCAWLSLSWKDTPPPAASQ